MEVSASGNRCQGAEEHGTKRSPVADLVGVFPMNTPRASRAGRRTDRSGLERWAEPIATGRADQALAWVLTCSLVGLLVVVLLDLAMSPGLPFWIPLGYLGMSAVAMLQFAQDRQRARLDGDRIPDGWLLVVAALGGWPGGLLAGVALRHKLRRSRFRDAFLFAGVLNAVVLALYALQHRGVLAGG